jgi:ATP-binding cassette subfamily F protein 3
VEKKKELAEATARLAGPAATSVAPPAVVKPAEAPAAPSSLSAANVQAAPAEAAKASGANRKEERQREAAVRQERSRVLKPLQEKLEGIETEIATCERICAEIEQKMSEPEFAGNKEKVRFAAEKYRTSKAKINTLYTQWSEVSDEIEKVAKRLEAQLAGLGS